MEVMDIIWLKDIVLIGNRGDLRTLLTSPYCSEGVSSLSLGGIVGMQVGKIIEKMIKQEKVLLLLVIICYHFIAALQGRVIVYSL